MATTDVKRLLEQATPLPWELMPYQHGGGRFHVGDRLVADVYHEGDRELIARLPAYEAAVEALAGLLETRHGAFGCGDRPCQCETHKPAREALRRVRGEPGG